MSDRRGKRPDKEKPKAPKSDWRAFFGFFKKVKLSWGLIVLTVAVTMGSMFLAMQIQMKTAALFSGDLSAPAVRSAVIAVLVQFLIAAATNILNMFAVARSVRSIRNTVWGRMMGVTADFYRENGPDRLLSAITADSTALVNQLMLMFSSVSSLVYVIFALRTLSGFNPKLGISLYIMIPIYILYALVIGKFHYKMTYGIQNQIGRLTGFLSDRVRNLGLIKSYATEDTETGKGEEVIDSLYHAKIYQIVIESVNTAVLLLETGLSMVLSVIVASVLLQNGEITMEAWMLSYMMNEQINNAVRQITNLWPQIKSNQGYAARLSALVDAPQEDTSATAPFVNGELKLQNVSFAYGDRAVLTNVNLTIPAGKMTAIVGLSGGGKTTTLSLVERLFQPSQGVITLNGENVNRIDLKAYRNHMAYVRQESDMFSGTLREILTYGVTKETDDEHILKAAEMVGMADFIKAQPNGLDTRIAAWGASLSGGQRQRLVIARELLKDADILLFDEPTNALDAKTAREVLDMITRVFMGKTVVVITHDLALIRDAAQIAVVENGTVADCGTHRELAERCGFYQELVAEQSFQEVYGNV